MKVLDWLLRRPDRLTEEEVAVFNEIESDHVIYIPSRKSPNMTPELWEKREILKQLVYKNRIRFDFYIPGPHERNVEPALVFYSSNMKGRGNPQFHHLTIWPEVIEDAEAR
jgi:hypothetical protein